MSLTFCDLLVSNLSFKPLNNKLQRPERVIHQRRHCLIHFNINAGLCNTAHMFSFANTCSLSQVQKEYPHLVAGTTAVARKMGFPDVIMPGTSLYKLFTVL